MSDKSKMYVSWMSLKAIFYYLFRKKKCPICFEKLVKIKEEEYLGLKKGSAIIDISTTSNNPYYEEYEVNISYKCNRCNKIFGIEELVNKTKKERIAPNKEEIKRSDEKIEKRIKKLKKVNKYIVRFVYIIFLLLSSFIFPIVEKEFALFLLIFPFTLILILVFESSIRE